MARAKEDPPWVDLARLTESLAKGPIARAYALRGEERYFRERGIAALRAKAEAAGHELCLHEAEGRDASDFSLARLIDDLSGGGLFAPKRFVLVRNPGELLKKVEDENSPLVRAALAFLASAEDVGTLVLSDSSLRADHALVKALVARGGMAPAFRKLWETPPPWRPDPLGAELVQWVLLRGQELGLRLTGEQAVYVAAATGNDLAAIDDQLETLKEGGGRDVKALVAWTTGGSPWSVADHLLAGDLPRALSGLEVLFRGGFQEKSGKRLLEPAGITSLLLGALTRGASAALAERTNPGSGGNSPGEKAARARAELRAAGDWHRLLEEIAALERRMKTGGGVALDDFAHLALKWSRSGPPRAKAAARMVKR
jgi:DNA polymerase III delta subunit